MMFLLQGAGVLSSSVVQGMVFKKSIDGDVTKIEKGKIAVYSCPVDSSSTETKVRTLLLPELKAGPINWLAVLSMFLPNTDMKIIQC